MSALVNHLVEYARLGSAPHRPQPISLRLLLDQACTNLNSQIAASRVHLEIQSDWPTLQCDPVSVCQVFQNLIGNAVKFLGPQPSPRVEVGCRERDHEWEIIVRDNGVGIPPEKHREIFRIFARLGQVETEGLGVGLSTYRGDGNPLPSFTGDPLLLPCAGNPEDLLDTYWEALDAHNRVALAVKHIPAQGGVGTIIVRNQQVAMAQ